MGVQTRSSCLRVTVRAYPEKNIPGAITKAYPPDTITGNPISLPFQHLYKTVYLLTQLDD